MEGCDAHKSNMHIKLGHQVLKMSFCRRLGITF